MQVEHQTSRLGLVVRLARGILLGNSLAVHLNLPYEAERQLVLERAFERELQRLGTTLRPRLPVSPYVAIDDLGRYYTRFGFDRLDYLQDTFLGLVNIEQNRIIKIFTVINIIFLPPTLIGSLYGMNFDFMPELHWQYGYAFALGLMVTSVVLILLIFRLKKWL